MIAGIILAGAHIWRDGAFESLCPRWRLPVANAPLIAYTLAWLRDAGITTIAVCANHGNRALQAYLLDGGSEALDLYYYEDRIPRGPAGCVRDAALLMEADQFVVVDGSILPAVDLRALLQSHEQHEVAASVVVHCQARQTAELDPWLSPVGIYVFAGRALAEVPTTGFQDIKESLLPKLHRAGTPVVAFPEDRASPRVRGLASYFEVQAWMLERLQARELSVEGYEDQGGTCLHRSAWVAPRARIVGSVMIGARSRVEDDAIVVGPTVIGCECLLGRGSATARSVLWDGCVVSDHAVADHCLVTPGAVLAPGEARHGATCRAPADGQPSWQPSEGSGA
jgi:NDP-sugar pyrophosphorylase family protein